MGWQCWEVGGGGGSITDWLCARVGPSGHVLATDIDPRFLAILQHPNLEVRQHNVVTEAPPTGPFDLVHTRVVLAQLPEWEQVLGHLVQVLRPGGWLLLEEPDWVTVVGTPPALAGAAAVSVAVWTATLRLFADVGADPFRGRHLYAALCQQPLVDTGSEGLVTMQRGGERTPDFFRLTLDQLRDRLIAGGYVSAGELETYLGLLDRPDFVWMTPIMMAVWGRRPVAERLL
jgi:SAM-dependent methyltransferase